MIEYIYLLFCGIILCFNTGYGAQHNYHGAFFIMEGIGLVLDILFFVNAFVCGTIGTVPAVMFVLSLALAGYLGWNWK